MFYKGGFKNHCWTPIGEPLGMLVSVGNRGDALALPE